MQPFLTQSGSLTWESFFTDALIQKTPRTPLAYRKKELNREYLKEHAASAIEATLPNLGFNLSNSLVAGPIPQCVTLNLSTF